MKKFKIFFKHAKYFIFFIQQRNRKESEIHDKSSHGVQSEGEKIIADF
ncbi:hypothetical protein HYX00_03880 [Candidatus Woesearchaeota archaeon]|nr:hypothetical protein [Candidatus Woesearchaeota archaeon]